MATKPKETAPVAAFEFLSPLDGKTYTLPPFDATKVVTIDDLASAHPEFIPTVSLTDALLADDPKVGMASLDAPIHAVNVLMKSAILKTLRNHMDADDPAWLALKNLIDNGPDGKPDFEMVAKVFTDWRAASGEVVTDTVGEG